MRLLIVAPYPIFPATAGGKIRVVQLARNLSELGVEVTVVTPFHFRQRRTLYAREPFRIRQVAYPFVQSLLTDRPYPYTYLTSFHPGFAALARPAFAGFDIYQFEHAQFAGLARLIPARAPVFYDAHNVEYDYGLSECAAEWAKGRTGRRLHWVEGRLLRRASHTFTVCAGDRERFMELYGVEGSRLSVAPNGIGSGGASGDAERAYRRFPELRRYARLAVFSGSNVAHNRDAVRFILGELAPAAPLDYAFVIHGTAGEAFRGWRDPRFFFDPEESNFADYCWPGTVGLNPVSQGSGTNLKVLHYCSHGLVVLSTPFGMRGYPDLARYVTVCPLGEFAAALGRGEFPVPPDRVELESRYGWRRSAEHMLECYSSALGRD